MNIKIFIINGVAKSGKDTFVKKIDSILDKDSVEIAVTNYSLINNIKEILIYNTIKGSSTYKEERDRKLMSDLLRLLEDYDGSQTTNLVTRIITDITDYQFYGKTIVRFVHIREPKDMLTFETKIGALLPYTEIKRVLITNSNISEIPNNVGDLSVNGGKYDITIENNGDLAQLEALARDFINKHIL